MRLQRYNKKCTKTRKRAKVYFQVSFFCFWAALCERTFEVGERSEVGAPRRYKCSRDARTQSEVRQKWRCTKNHIKCDWEKSPTRPKGSRNLINLISKDKDYMVLRNILPPLCIFGNIQKRNRWILNKCGDKQTSPREEACERIIYEGFTLFPFPWHCRFCRHGG